MVCAEYSTYKYVLRLYQHVLGMCMYMPEPAPLLAMSDTQAAQPQWLEYIYRTAYPVLRWLLTVTKLAEWVGENLQDQLGFPDKADQRAEPGTGWTSAELNQILTAHVVDCALTTLGCVQWESQLFRGVMRARCYPFNLPKKRFYSMNPQVGCTFINFKTIPGTYWYILVDTKHILDIYRYIPRMMQHNSSLTALRRIAMMLPWKTVGLGCPSSSSAATCAQRVEECQTQAVTKQAQSISGTTWFSSAHLRSLCFPSKDPWKMLGWSSLMNHPRHSVSTWLPHACGKP
jgi:hypothetical protein